MKKIAFAALLAASFGVAHADVITFEGVSTATVLPAGYGGLDWSNFYGLHVTNSYVHTGYANDLESGSYVAFNAGGTAASISAPTAAGFDLTDAFFAGAWSDGLNITATAHFENGTSATKSFTVDTTHATDEVFDWIDLSSVSFVSSGGTHHAGLGGNGTQFALDNVDTTPAVPEPASVSMALAGVGLLAFLARRRRSS